MSGNPQAHLLNRLFHIKLTNVSNGTISIPQEISKKGEFHYRFSVVEVSGVDPVMTDRHRAFRGEALSTGALYVMNGNDFSVELLPGKSIEDETDIGALYSIDRAGTYEIQVSRLYNYGRSEVKSNTLTVTVLPHP